MSDLPPIPEGYTLETTQTSSAVPPLPDGYTLAGENPPMPPWSVRIKALMGDPDAQKTMDAANAAALRNSPVGGVVRGLRDVVDSGAQLAAHGLAAIAPAGSSLENFAQNQIADVNRANQAAEADYENNWRRGAPPSLDSGRLVGNIFGTAPLAAAMPGAAAPSLAARMGAGGLGGAASGALQRPVSPDSPYWPEVAHRALTGALAGAAAPAVLGAAARVIQPDTSPEVQRLMDAGVRPTPGQMLGGAFNRAEQGLTSVPVAGDFIKNARRDAVMQFDRGAINQALAPIGETLEAPTIGRDAIAEMQDKIGAAYDRIVPHLGIPAVGANGAPSAAAAQLGNDIGTILQAAPFLPQERASQLTSILQKQILDRLSPAGGMTGESFQEAKSELGKLAAQYMNSSTADERQLGGALLQAQVALRDALRTANPAAAQELANADNAFAHLLRVQNAASRVGGEPGAFSPAQLQSATRALDPSLRKRAFAAGDALMQDYAEAGRNVLGNTVPDSGTPYRHALQLGMGLVGAHMGGEALGIPPQYSTAAALGLGGLTGLTGLLYSRPGRTLLAHALASRPEIAAPIAGAVRSASPVASVAGAPVLTALGF